MKIDKNHLSGSIVPLKPARSEQIKTQVSLSPVADSSHTSLSQALQGALEGIQSSSLSAGDVHSHLQPGSVEKLLSDSPVHAVQPRLSDDQLLRLAEKVRDQILASPEAAVASFQNIRPERVFELI